MSKLILIGIDGASWPVIDALLRENKLPTFQKLIKNGIRKILQNVNTDPWKAFSVYREYIKKIPCLGKHSDLAGWTTLATGTIPQKHGILSSTQKNTKGIEIPISHRKRKKPAVWEILARHNRKIGIIGWPGNWPPRPLSYYNIAKISDILISPIEQESRHGCMYPQLNRANLRCNLAYPRWLEKDLSKIRCDSEIGEFISRVSPYAKIFAARLAYDGLYLEWSKYLLKKFPQPDFLAIFVHEIHNLSHIFWDCLKIEQNNFKGIVHQRRRQRLGTIIEDYYRYIDRKLNQVLQLVDSNSIVMVFSGHGMLRSRITKKYLLMNKLYESLGLLQYKNDKINWENTSIYDNQNPWGIFAIRKGFIRDKYPERVFESLEKSLRKVKTDKRKPLFLDIKFNKKDNSFTVTPNYRAIRYSTKISINKRVLPVTELVDFRPHYSLHSPEGIFILSGKSIQRFRINESTLTFVDILPTILHLLGVKYKNKDLKGRIILKESQ